MLGRLDLQAMLLDDVRTPLGMDVEREEQCLGGVIGKVDQRAE